ncbi:MAG: hypothetical protein ACYDDU_06200 [Dermatophilaceae bacterium]
MGSETYRVVVSRALSVHCPLRPFCPAPGFASLGTVTVEPRVQADAVVTVAFNVLPTFLAQAAVAPTPKPADQQSQDEGGLGKSAKASKHTDTAHASKHTDAAHASKHTDAAHASKHAKAAESSS